MKNESIISLPIRKVALYKHGMGYFERSGSLNGADHVELTCSLDEIDDMLKSLIVLSDAGSPANITYDSSKPTNEKLSEFGFDLRKVKGFPDLLGQLKGASVIVDFDDRQLEGRLTGVDRAERVVGSTVVVDNYAVLYSALNGLTRVDLAAIKGIRFKDEKLAAEVTQQLDLLYLSFSKKDRKNLLVNLDQGGQGKVTIAYSIPTPIWKTSYRLVFLPDERLLLQGTAIVDNVQDEDWEDVAVTLVSAHPISFIQPLYEPIKPQRKRIAPQGLASTEPFIPERAVPAAPVLAGAMSLRQEESFDGSWGAASTGAGIALQMQDFAEQSLEVEAVESGELFEYRIEKPVTIPRDSSSLIPIVQQEIRGERVSLFNENKNNEFPYAAVKFKNSTGLTLESGPVTVFEESSYAGECLLDVVKPDDKRILPYALDKSISITVQRKHEEKPVYRVQLLNGILIMHSKRLSRMEYKAENLAAKEKVLYIEHPVQESWSLVSEQEPEEETKNFYRFRLVLSASSSRQLVVETESPSHYRINIANLRQLDNQFQWLLAQNFASESFFDSVKAIGTLLSEIGDLNEHISSIHVEIKDQKDNQARARENVKTLGANAVRFQEAIENIENRIAELQSDLETANSLLKEKYSKLKEAAMKEMESELVLKG